MTRALTLLAGAGALAAATASIAVANPRVASACRGAHTSVASASQFANAQQQFAVAFERIRQYLLAPTLANQRRMYARVYAPLFFYYSYESGDLNSNKGKVKGTFSSSFQAGSQCFDAAAKSVSFEVKLTARFKSTNGRKLNFSQSAAAAVTGLKVTKYTALHP